jgi:hypothetical protein
MDLRHDSLRKQRPPIVRTTAIAAEPIGSIRTMDLRQDLLAQRLLHHFYEPFPTVEHYEQVLTGSSTNPARAASGSVCGHWPVWSNPFDSAELGMFGSDIYRKR